MSYIFEITDKTGRKIHLTSERWSHITSPQSLHPYMANYLEEIKQVLIKPTLIMPHKFDPAKRSYCLYLNNRKLYLLVVIKYLNGEGYVTTAFLTRKIIRR